MKTQIIREKIYFWLNQRKNIQQLESYGYKTDNLNDMYIYNSLSLIQYPEGMTFPLSMPPNMILLNSFNIYDYQSEGAPLKEGQYIYVTKDIYEMSGLLPNLHLTKNGYAVLVDRGFDTRELLKKWPDVGLKKDDLLLVHWAVNCSNKKEEVNDK